jgi:crotonobetainyl-CoA:carnitine CoA-transferase CaiB-like acyl-CoA transferase
MRFPQYRDVVAADADGLDIMTNESNGGPRPLAGLRVIDLTRALSGPFCSMILADLGADVVKVEPLPNGEMSRAWGPFDHGVSAYFLSTNRNKRNLAVDFRKPEGLALIRELAVNTDIVVENFKPGTMEEMGLGYSTLSVESPRLIMASISGFGSTGPAGQWPGFDQIAQGYSGLMSLTGSTESGPTRVGVAIGDSTAGMWAALGVLSAVIARATSGVGQHVETSLLAGLVAMLNVQAQRYLSLGEIPLPNGNAHPVISPYGSYETADGPLNIATATQDMWRKLAGCLGLESLLDDPRFVDNAARFANRDVLKSLMEEKLKTRSKVEWSRELIALGIPAGPIYNLAEVFADPQVRHCEMVEEIAHPQIGMLRQVGSPIRMESLGPHIAVRPPPTLGEHTLEVLTDYGFTAERIAELQDSGVIR